LTPPYHTANHKTSTVYVFIIIRDVLSRHLSSAASKGVTTKRLQG